jgi:cardiolipin synthase
MINIPNTLTLLRLLMVPMVIVAINQSNFAFAFFGFVIAGITDGVDGFIARHFNQKTELGAYLDPLADKALIVSIYVSLAITGHLPGWLAVLVVSRDVLIVGAVILSWGLDHPVTIRPLIVSKANTAMQIVFAALVLASLGFAIDWPRVVAVAQAIVSLLTLVSMAAYLWSWLTHMAGLDGTEG